MEHEYDEQHDFSFQQPPFLGYGQRGYQGPRMGRGGMNRGGGPYQGRPYNGYRGYRGPPPQRTVIVHRNNQSGVQTPNKQHVSKAHFQNEINALKKKLENVHAQQQQRKGQGQPQHQQQGQRQGQGQGRRKRKGKGKGRGRVNTPGQSRRGSKANILPVPLPEPPHTQPKKGQFALIRAEDMDKKMQKKPDSNESLQSPLRKFLHHNNVTVRKPDPTNPEDPKVTKGELLELLANKINRATPKNYIVITNKQDFYTYLMGLWHLTEEGAAIVENTDPVKTATAKFTLQDNVITNYLHQLMIRLPTLRYLPSGFKIWSFMDTSVALRYLGLGPEDRNDVYQTVIRAYINYQEMKGYLKPVITKDFSWPVFNPTRSLRSMDRYDEAVLNAKQEEEEAGTTVATYSRRTSESDVSKDAGGLMPPPSYQMPPGPPRASASVSGIPGSSQSRSMSPLRPSRATVTELTDTGTDPRSRGPSQTRGASSERRSGSRATSADGRVAGVGNLRPSSQFEEDDLDHPVSMASRFTERFG